MLSSDVHDVALRGGEEVAGVRLVQVPGGVVAGSARGRAQSCSDEEEEEDVAEPEAVEVLVPSGVVARSPRLRRRVESDGEGGDEAVVGVNEAVGRTGVSGGVNVANLNVAGWQSIRKRKAAEVSGVGGGNEAGARAGKKARVDPPTVPFPPQVEMLATLNAKRKARLVLGAWNDVVGKAILKEYEAKVTLVLTDPPYGKFFYSAFVAYETSVLWSC